MHTYMYSWLTNSVITLKGQHTVIPHVHDYTLKFCSKQCMCSVDELISFLPCREIVFLLAFVLEGGVPSTTGKPIYSLYKN